LSRLLRDAAAGRFPPPDGAIAVVGQPPGRLAAVVAFTASHVVAADIDPDEIARRLPPGDLSAPLSAALLGWLGQRIGRPPGSLDAVLVAASTGQPDGDALVPIDVSDHPRVLRAHRYRGDLRLLSDQQRRAVVVIGRGLAGRWEVSLEVDPSHRGAGLGRALLTAARGVLPRGEPLFAQVAPGNAASLRAFIAAGFLPIGAEVLFAEPDAAACSRVDTGGPQGAL
jgi:GNAT superfamily N-acetyltransferase